MRTPLEVIGENATHLGKKNQPETDESIREWRAQWMRQLRSSVFFLDRVESTGFATLHSNLGILGVRFITFFDRSVTHVITSRSLDKQYGESDILTVARNFAHIKVWTLEKLERFLTSLLGHSPRKAITRAKPGKLEQLLHKEKLSGGPTDKDQWLEFGDNYLLVYDPSDRYKPVAHKEWSGNYPQLFDAPSGLCPFVAVHGGGGAGAAGVGAAGKKREREEQKDEQSKKFALEEKENVAPAPALRQPTLRTRQYGEIVASGIQRNSATSAIVSNAARELTPQSREVLGLARKVLPPPKPRKQKKVRKPGFCENCYERFDNIDDHVQSARHRRYAKDKNNFSVLDKIISAFAR